MMDRSSCRQVNRKVATPGGTTAAISAISSSGMIPDPLGIWLTSPSAEMPWRMASHTSVTLPMQRTVSRGLGVGSIR
jgi:hypothetical protein